MSITGYFANTQGYPTWTCEAILKPLGQSAEDGRVMGEGHRDSERKRETERKTERGEGFKNCVNSPYN